MANGFKYGTKTPDAVKFDAPIVEYNTRYDFTQWSLNTNEQPSGGIVVKKDEVIITKFRPNKPILISNFTGTGENSTPSNTEICTLSALTQAHISGFTPNIDKFTNYAEANIRRSWGNVTYKGLWFGPIYTYNGVNTALPTCVDISNVDGAVITYADSTTEEVGSDLTLRGTGGGYGQYMHVTDKFDTTTPNWVNIPAPFYYTEAPSYAWGPWAYWQMAIILFTGYTPDANGYITLSTPIKIRQYNNYPVDVTTIEGYKVSLGNNLLYGKTKSFANTLLSHGLVNKQSGTYQYPNGNAYHPIESSSEDGGVPYAYPIGGRYFDSTARFTIKDTTGDASLYVNGFYYLESLGWYPGDPQIAVGDTVTVYGKIVGVDNIVSVKSCSTQEHSGRIYQLNGARSIIGSAIPAPGTAGTAGTLQEPYTVAAALARAKTLGNGVVDDTAHYITGKITAITSSIAPPYWEYDKLRLPVPTDLAGLITSWYPLKFWCTQYDDQDHPGFWAAVADIFEDNPIEDSKYGNHLFANSGGNLEELTLTFDVGENHFIDIGDIFNHSNLVEEVNINITTGYIKSLHNAFLSCGSIQTVNINKLINVSDFSGAFEGAAMTTFPANIATSADWDKYSEPVAMINFAADGSKLTTFGNYRDDQAQTVDAMCYSLVVSPYCVGAFARSNITTIKYILDMKFVSPTAGWINDAQSGMFNAIFGAANSQASTVSTVYLKNLNKGNWHFDGTAENGAYAGKLSNIDAGTISYMLDNVFDLRRNTSEASRVENSSNSLNGWSASTGTLRPVQWETETSATLTKTLSSAVTMHADLTLVNCKLTVNGTDYTQSATDVSLSLNSGSCTISVTQTSGDVMYCKLAVNPSYVFESEITPGLSSATIYLPEDLYTNGKLALIDPDAVTKATTYGWEAQVTISGSPYILVNNNGAIDVVPKS